MAKLKAIWQKICETAARKYKTSALLFGLLLVAALPPFYHTWAVFTAFCGVFALSQKQSSVKRLSAIGYWFGFGYFSAGFYWIGNALLIDAAKTGWLYPFVLLLGGGFFGLFTIFPFAVMKLGKNIFSKILLLAAGWYFSAEWLRSVFLTGFPWNPLGSVLAFNPLWLQTLAWWGTYGLSMMIVVIATLPAVWLLKPNKRNLWTPLCSLLLISGLYIYGDFALVQWGKLNVGEQIRVRLVQPSIPQTMKWSRDAIEKNFAQYVDLSRAEGLENIDFVVWGETASPFNLVYDLEHRLMAQEAVPPKGYLLAGILQDGYDTNTGDYLLYNSLAAMDYFGQIHDIYSKNHLVPFGEYIPLRKYLPKWIKPLTNMIGQFGKGEKYQTLKLDGYAEFAPLICYEVIFSGQIVRRQNKPKWAVVLTNDGWYGISAGPYQHLVAAQMRAVEEGISIVRSANSGISAVINPYGIITSQIGLSERGYIDDTVKISMSHQTLFGEYGNKIPLIVAMLLVIISASFNFLQKAKSAGI